ncbi:MAG: thioredoxin family protein [Pirellulales bacterium]|nr:thioredoxin family protein [Pirellulales bacterium]
MRKPFARDILLTIFTLAGSVLPVTAAGQVGGGSLGAFGSSLQKDEPAVAVSAQFTTVTSGKPARLFITAAMKPTWHIYSLSQKPGGPVPSKITLEPSDQYRLAGAFQSSPPPEEKKEEAFGGLVVESHYDKVVWHAPIELAPATDPAKLKIEGSVRVQPCDPSSCLPPQRLPFSAVLGPGVPLPDEKEQEQAAVAAPPATVQPDTAGRAAPAFDPKAVVVDEQAELQKTSLPVVLFLGFVGGLILNLMPCVLPVIGLKILSFVQQAGHSRAHALILNIWYSAGILCVFLVLATLAAFLGYGWGQLFSIKEFNITLAAVVFAMGLSFLGVWEIPVPGFVGAGKASDLAQREGPGGAFAKGILTTILATPCSAPFLGSALAWAINQPPVIVYSVFIAVGLGMASPYLLIGAFPGLMRFLPKPGEWMETFKQVLGFVLMGTVVFLLTFIPWEYVVPTVALLFGIWFACWWIGRTPYTADPAVRLRSWLSAAAITGIAWLVAFGWLADVMGSRFHERVERTITERLAEASVAGTAAASEAAPTREPSVKDRLPWKPFTRAGFEQFVTAGKTVLIDFTADWCLTCKTLETAYLNTAEVRRLVETNQVVTLKADWTNGDPEVTEMLRLLGSKQVPVIAVFPGRNPNNPIALIDGYTQQSVLLALEKAGPSLPERGKAGPGGTAYLR